MRLLFGFLLFVTIASGCGDSGGSPSNGTPVPTASPTPTATPLVPVEHTYAADTVECIGADSVTMTAEPFGDSSMILCEWKCALWFDEPKQVRLRFAFVAGSDRIDYYGEDTYPDTIEECANP